MRQRKVFTVEIEIEETRDQTDARATLEIGMDRLVGKGHAQRNPSDPDVPKVGEELAMARALLVLARTLNDKADVDVEAFEGHDVHIRL
jgi:hypothetical protein